MPGWRDETIAGFRAMGASFHADAAAHWLSARDELRPLAVHEAFVAAAETNAGVARLLLGQPDMAEIALVSAEQNWARCLDGVATWDVELAGSSSSFHLTLASRNVGAFQNALRRRVVRQYEAGLTITRFNRLLASRTPAASDALAVASLLSDVLGPLSPEVRLLHASSRDSLYAEKAADLASRPGPISSAAHERRNVEGAVALTALLRPGFPCNVLRHPLPDAHSTSPP